MKKYVILTDSSCDLGKERRELLDVEYIKMTLTSQEGDMLVDLDWNQFTPKQFYDAMRNGTLYKTTQINAATYMEYFKKYLDKGYDVLSITCSSGLSGSINSSLVAKSNLEVEYPKSKIICIDSLRGSMAQGLLVEYAANLRKDGKTIEEVASWIEENKQNINQVGTVDDLIYLKRAGRVTGAAAFFSGLFQIKPIIIANRKGENESISKLRGRNASIRAIINHVKEHIINPTEQTIFISHADCIEEARFIEDCLLEELKCKDVYINYVGPVIGATVGPGMLGIYFYGEQPN